MLVLPAAVVKRSQQEKQYRMVTSGKYTLCSMTQPCSATPRLCLPARLHRKLGCLPGTGCPAPHPWRLRALGQPHPQTQRWLESARDTVHRATELVSMLCSPLSASLLDSKVVAYPTGCSMHATKAEVAIQCTACQLICSLKNVHACERTISLDLDTRASCSRRGSGTATMPVLGSIVQKG